MLFINQIYLVLLAIILLGVLSSSVHKTQLTLSSNDRNLWPISILCRVCAFATWALSPLVSLYWLVLANVLFVGSGIALVMFIRSFRISVSDRIKLGGIVFCLIFAVGFATLIWDGVTLEQRFLYTSIVVLMISCWELYETLAITRRDKSYLLKVMIFVVTLQVL